MSERFAFKIDKALKLNLYKICRLCGIDHPEKVNILSNEMNVINLDEDVELWQKIDDLIGFKVAKDDKMPQTMCTICFDKINDFYEFKEMCYSTDAQTRKLLGLKPEDHKKKAVVVIKSDIDSEELQSLSGKRGRKRKPDEINTLRMDIKKDIDESYLPSTITRKRIRLGETSSTGAQRNDRLKPKVEIKDEPLDIFTPEAVINSKLKQVCTICTQRFTTKGKLERHLASEHMPIVPRFFCVACNESFRKKVDNKNHQLWHKLSRTPYKCQTCWNLLNTLNSYSRHMREHCFQTPPTLLVLDRLCAQCHEVFPTHFLYNIHNCALQTHKCGGCNRQMRGDIELLRHAATCSKAYLNYSKHVANSAVSGEDCVRIKNENEVEAAEELARMTGVSLEMAPVVSLKRLPSPLVMSGNQCVAIPALSLPDDAGTTGAVNANSGNKAMTLKKGTKKGVSRKDLKRVDELLKSTLDALVSIKHEPEVHMEMDESATEANENEHENPETPEDTEGDDALDDFHHGDADDNGDGDDQDENDNVGDLVAILPITSMIKVEPPDGESSVVTMPSVQIKQEILDTNSEDVGANTNKLPALRIKIKKEHGTLNSSLVDVVTSPDDSSMKKRKKTKSMDKSSNIAPDGGLSASTVRIKQEPLDEVEQQSATFSMPQFHIASVVSGVELGHDENERDVKPNREELDRLMELHNAHTNNAEMISTVTNEHDPSDFSPTKRSKKSTYASAERTGSGRAMKSTGGISKNTYSIPKIVNVRGGMEMSNDLQEQTSSALTTGIIIKTEPSDTGYESQLSETPAMPEDDSNTVVDTSKTIDNEGEHKKQIDEAAYIDGIDFNNVRIKQEPNELDISDVQISEKDINGADSDSDSGEEDDDDDDDDNDSDDDGEENENESEEKEERIYRELEMPTLIKQLPLAQAEEANQPSTHEIENMSMSTTPCMNLVISNVRSAVTTVLFETATKENTLESNINNKVDKATRSVVSESNCITGTVSKAKDMPVNALPFHISEPTEISTFDDDVFVPTPAIDSQTRAVDEEIDEEQQNALNHEMLEQAAHTDDYNVQRLASTSVALNTSSSDGTTTSMIPGPSKLNREETENLINESTDAVMRQTQQQQYEQNSIENEGILLDERVDEQDQLSMLDNENVSSSPSPILPSLAAAHAVSAVRALLLDDRNINEIAENNNNANIERELQDDIGLDMQPQNNNNDIDENNIT